MPMNQKIRVVYVTSSRFKQEENKAFLNESRLPDGRRVEEIFEFDIREVPIQETLHVDLSAMVSAE